MPAGLTSLEGIPPLTRLPPKAPGRPIRGSVRARSRGGSERPAPTSPGPPRADGRERPLLPGLRPGPEPAPGHQSFQQQPDRLRGGDHGPGGGFAVCHGSFKPDGGGGQRGSL